MDLVRKHICENLNTCFVCTYMYKKLLFCDVNILQQGQIVYAVQFVMLIFVSF